MLEGKTKTESAKAEPEEKEEKEEKAEVKPVKQSEKKETKPSPKFDDLSDAGINKEVESLKTGKQETKDRYASLLRELKSAREQGDLTKREFEQAKKDLDATKQSAEAASKKAVVPEDVLKQQQAEREELAMLRRQYQLERDPELKKNFDDRIDSVEQSISKTLTEAGLAPKAVELIQKSGGWSAFSRSKAPMAWTDVEIDRDTGDKKEVIRHGTQAEYARYVLERIDPADSAAVNARSGEQTLLRDGRQRFIDEEKKKAGEYFGSLEKKFKESQEATQANLQKLTKAYDDWAEETFKNNDLLKDEVASVTATPEEKKAIEEANADRSTIREYVKAQAKTTSLGGYQELVMNAVKGLFATRITEAAESEIEALTKKLAEKDEELAKVRGGNRSVTRGGSLTGSGGSVAEKPAKKEASVDAILADLDKMAEDRSS
jgi:hypothetical protein